MPRSRDWRFRLEDIVDAIEAIGRYTQAANLEEFRADRRTVDAVIRNLEVVGEAARHVPEGVKARFADVPWQDMAEMRNVLAHEYFGVDLNIVWRTVKADLPELAERLKQILREP